MSGPLQCTSAHQLAFYASKPSAHHVQVRQNQASIGSAQAVCLLETLYGSLYGFLPFALLALDIVTRHPKIFVADYSGHQVLRVVLIRSLQGICIAEDAPLPSELSICPYELTWQPASVMEGCLQIV